jgi:hypothetical protein
MIHWQPYELHTHTFHSDGKQSLLELAEAKNNIRAFALWTDLLNRGIRISATSGRDWHIKDPVKEPVCATYLQMDPGEGTEFGVINAVRNGEIAVSMGPLPFISIRTLEGHVIAGIGGSISRKAHASSRFEVLIGVEFTARSGQWEIVDTSVTMRLNSNKGEIALCELSKVDQERMLSLDLDGVRWLRAEMFGTFHQVHTMIGFTNPIYFND